LLKIWVVRLKRAEDSAKAAEAKVVDAEKRVQTAQQAGAGNAQAQVKAVQDELNSTKTKLAEAEKKAQVAEDKFASHCS